MTNPNHELYQADLSALSVRDAELALQTAAELAGQSADTSSDAPFMVWVDSSEPVQTIYARGEGGLLAAFIQTWSEARSADIAAARTEAGVSPFELSAYYDARRIDIQKKIAATVKRYIEHPELVQDISSYMQPIDKGARWRQWHIVGYEPGAAG